MKPVVPVRRRFDCRRQARLRRFVAAAALIALAAGAAAAARSGAGPAPAASAAARASPEHVLADAVAWNSSVEARLLTVGRPLSAAELEVARLAGVQRPQKVRLVVFEQFPLPADAALSAEFERYGLGSVAEAGRSMGYAILLKPWAAADRMVLTQQLVQVAEQERLGGPEFLRRRLFENEVHIKINSITFGD